MKKTQKIQKIQKTVVAKNVKLGFYVDSILMARLTNLLL